MIGCKIIVKQVETYPSPSYLARKKKVNYVVVQQGTSKLKTCIKEVTVTERYIHTTIEHGQILKCIGKESFSLCFFI